MTSAVVSTNSTSYWHYIWKIPANRKLLLWGFGISIGLFVIFKLLYPYPDFFSDSYSYIFAAAAHLNINIWPIGYSKFLLIFHKFTHSDTALVAFQYFFIQLSALHIFFTVLYFSKTSQTTKTVFFTFLFVNPLTLYLSNTINSDAIFGGLSLFWITELIWIIQKPKLHQFFTQSILLFLCFCVRNNAYYYPIIAAAAFILSKQLIWRKIFGISLTLVLLISFVTFTKNAAYRLTGTNQFSLFTGWQLANNALYIYDRVEVDSTLLQTPEAKELNRISINFFGHVKQNNFHTFLNSYVGNFYIREPEAPLKQYYGTHYKITDNLSNIVTWARASAVFEPFAKSILYHHPIAYFKYFIIPNTWHYFIPPLSHLEKYNYGGDIVAPIAKFWFDYPTLRIHVFSHEFQGFLLMIYPVLFLVINFFYVWNCFRANFQNKHYFKNNPNINIYRLVLLFFLANLGFSLITTSNILRYQFVPMIVILGFSLLQSDVIEMQNRKTTELIKTTNQSSTMTL